MNTKRVEDIASAVLYEGYLLYPYRASAIKNQQRWNFGVVYPRAHAEQQSASSDAWNMRTECLLRATPNAILWVRARFLHLIGAAAMEREIALPELALSELSPLPLRQGTVFPPIQNQQGIQAVVEVETERLDSDLVKLRVTIFNAAAFTGSTREEALNQSLVSTHIILSTDHGEFVSLLDPPEELREAAAGCENRGLWPVLVGEEGQKDAMLCSPIILYDYPRIAPESPGALFDGTEIDEILTLRIMTLTDEEKLAMHETDERTREILARTESMPPEQFMKLHGVLRGLRETSPETTP
jgi:hypothetical protein